MPTERVGLPTMILKPITRIVGIPLERDITRQWIRQRWLMRPRPRVKMGIAFQTNPVVDLPLLRQRNAFLVYTPEAFLD